MKKIIIIAQERWGDIHPDKLYNWYDPSAVEIVGEDLVLKTHHNPKEFTVNNEKIAVACSLSGCKASKPACDAYAQVK
jgi:hypothetical protein